MQVMHMSGTFSLRLLSLSLLSFILPFIIHCFEVLCVWMIFSSSGREKFSFSLSFLDLFDSPKTLPNKDYSHALSLCLCIQGEFLSVTIFPWLFHAFQSRTFVIQIDCNYFELVFFLRSWLLSSSSSEKFDFSKFFELHKPGKKDRMNDEGACLVCRYFWTVIFTAFTSKAQK